MEAQRKALRGSGDSATFGFHQISTFILPDFGVPVFSVILIQNPLYLLTDSI